VSAEREKRQQLESERNTVQERLEKLRRAAGSAA